MRRVTPTRLSPRSQTGNGPKAPNATARELHLAEAARHLKEALEADSLEERALHSQAAELLLVQAEVLAGNSLSATPTGDPGRSQSYSPSYPAPAAPSVVFHVHPSQG
eukprot:Hpha_TRINITY_DN3226_c0_g1::TRINITY_DN3226_c0_g1_i1::g.185790::m.185790